MMPPRTLLSLLACFAAQLLVALVVVPPWQNPDEPQHLLTTRLVQTRGPDFDVVAEFGNSQERPIVASMARYGWWQHYRQATPDPLPSTFADGPAKVVGQYFGPPGGGSRLDYRALSALFDAGSIQSLLSQLYVMRLLSALAAMLSLWCIWSGTRAILNEPAAAVVAALVALHPQFVFVSTSASPDAFVNLAGSIVWREAAVLMSSGFAVGHVAAMWAGALTAFVLRRLGAPVIAVAAVITVIVIGREIVRRGAWRAAMASTLIAVAVLAAAATVVGTDFDRALNFVSISPSQAASTVTANANRLPVFFDMLFRTFWLSAGWLRFPGPPWWHVITVAMSVIVAAGLCREAYRNPSRALWLSMAMVSIQVAAVVVYQFGIVQFGPQGRYLFPVLPAIFALVWLGWNAVIGRHARPQLAAASLVIVMAFLNASAWTFVVLPAYL